MRTPTRSQVSGGGQSLFTPRFLRPDENIADARMVRVLEEHYLRGTEAEQSAFMDELDTMLDYGGDRTLRRAMEALDEDQFSSFMRYIVHLRVMDGLNRPSFRNWEPFIDRNDFDDLEVREAFRFTEPGEFKRRTDFKSPVPVVQMTEVDMPSWRGYIYESAWSFNFMATKLRDLEARLSSVLAVGTRWNYGVEKFIFQDLLEGNPQITVDGETRTLFSTSWTGGSNDVSGNAIVALDRPSLKNALQAFGSFKQDGREVEVIPRYVIVAANSDNSWTLDELLRAEYKHGATAGDLTPEVLNERAQLQKVETHLLDADSWFVAADVSMDPALAIEFGFWEGQEAPEVIDLDEQRSRHFKETGENWWVARGGYGGVARNYRAFVRGSTAS